MLSPGLRRAAHLGLGVLLISPAVARATPLTAFAVFQDAALPVQVIGLGLVISTLAAVVVCLVKLASGPRLAGGSAFLSGLRLGGPLAGLVGAAYGGLLIAMNLANTTGPAPMPLIARGVAEAMMLILLGLIAGAVAVIANWAVEARIDRVVLSD
jgi:hypothetical protein